MRVEIFRLHLYDCHCRHTLFGCSHDNGYARLLEDVAEPAIMNSITLLEGVPFEKEFSTLKSKYNTTRFDGLFRATKINPYQQLYYQPQATSQLINHISTNPTPSPSPLAQYQSPYQPTISRTPPTTNLSTSSMNPMASSWASTAISGASRVASPPLAPPPAAAVSNVIPRNRYGQRIDPPMKYDHNDVKRVKEIHMCNVHFSGRIVLMANTVLMITLTNQTKMNFKL